jgi:hypothetical protein
VAIDPYALAAVFDGGGELPERWVVVSKGRGSEAHKGNAAMVAGDAADRCVVSWLGPVLDEAACLSAAEILPPELE